MDWKVECRVGSGVKGGMESRVEGGTESAVECGELRVECLEDGGRRVKSRFVSGANCG